MKALGEILNVHENGNDSADKLGSKLRKGFRLPKVARLKRFRKSASIVDMLALNESPVQESHSHRNLFSRSVFPGGLTYSEDATMSRVGDNSSEEGSIDINRLIEERSQSPFESIDDVPSTFRRYEPADIAAGVAPPAIVKHAPKSCVDRLADFIDSRLLLVEPPDIELRITETDEDDDSRGGCHTLSEEVVYENTRTTCWPRIDTLLSGDKEKKRKQIVHRTSPIIIITACSSDSDVSSSCESNTSGDTVEYVPPFDCREIRQKREESIGCDDYVYAIPYKE